MAHTIHDIPMVDEPVQLFLDPGSMVLASEGSLIRTVLGSSVTVCLWDRQLLIGGMNHFLYPRPVPHESPTARFGSAATLHLVKLMIQSGSSLDDLVAQLYGGSFPEGGVGADVGRDNIAVARAVLDKKGIPVVSEDVGGCMGRKVIFDISTGHVVVYKVHRLRRDDWAAEVW